MMTSRRESPCDQRKKRGSQMEQKVRYFMVLAVVFAAMCINFTPLCATETDDRIESSFDKSFVITDIHGVKSVNNKMTVETPKTK